MKSIFIFLAALLIPELVLAAAAPARAGESFGLAMHGAPRYAADAPHLDYANPDAPRGGTLKQAAPGTFDSLNPFAIKGKAALGLDLVYDRLTMRVWDEPFTLYPLIAEKIEVPEDRSSLTVHINPAAKFHDGAPVTAEDVLFSFETLRDSGRPNMRRVYKLADEAKVVDGSTVYFHFAPGYDRETVMIFAMMPVLQKAWWSKRPFDSAVLETPVGNGPYRVREMQPGRRIVLERVKDYWAANLPLNRGLYNFDEVVFDYYRDDTVAFEAFKAGDIGLRREWDAGKWASAYDFPAVEKGDIITETLPHGRPERVRSFIFNTRRPPFDDVRVRKALNYAFDFNWANDKLYHGQYKRITSFFPNSELAARYAPGDDETAILAPFKDSLPPEVFGPAWQPPEAKNQKETRDNLRIADELLKEAGWIVKGGKRVRADDPSRAFTFEILLETADDEKIALSFQRSLKRLGIEARVRPLDTAAFRGRLNEYDFDMVLHYWLNTLSPGSEQILYWGCDAAKEPARWNYAGICAPAADAISLAIAGARSREDLVAHARALDRVLTWGWYMVPLYYTGVDYVAHRDTIHAPPETPLYGMVIETWWAEPSP